MAGHLLVGYDATATSRQALLWAATEARRRGARLTVVTIADSAPLMNRRPAEMASWWRTALDDARQCAAAGAAKALAAGRGLDVDVLAQVGSPGRLLVSLSRGADLVVLGIGGRSVPRPSSLARPGSVAESVAMHGSPPVILIGGRLSPRPGPARPIVVGVDGSREAVHAVQMAAALAADARAPLRLVCVVRGRARSRRRGIGTHASSDPMTARDADRILRTAEELARQVGGVKWVTRSVLTGRPQSVLRREAAHGGLLVVGRRGHGAERSVTLGSVSRGLLRALRTPLAVVGLQVHAPGDVVPLLVERFIPAGGGRSASAAGTVSS
jgi:nucleotide-binding universal stress UspA family protein